MSRQTRPLALLAFLALAAARPHPAAASPFEDGALGGDVFTGPTHPHASSIYVNPAAMGLALPGWHVYLGGNLQLDQLSVDRRLVDPTTGAITDGPSASALTPTGSGMFAGFWKSGNAAIGLATFTPLAERFPADVDAFRYHTLGGHHMQWNVFSLSVAFRWNKFWFGIGVGLGNMQSMRLRFARDTALEAGTPGIEADCGDGEPCGAENPAASQTYRVDVATRGLRPFKPFDFLGSLFSGENLSVNAGALWMPRDDFFVALSYQGSSGLFGSRRRLEGTVRVESSPLEGEILRTGEAEIGYALPETFNLAARTTLWGSGDFDVLANLRWQTLDSHDELDVRMFGGDLTGHDIPEQYTMYRGFRDVFKLELGLEHKPFHPLRFGGRLFAETGAVAADAVTPLGPAGTNLGFAGGLEWRLGASLVLSAGYALAWYPSMTGSPDVFDPRARVACVDSGFQLDECAAVREGRGRPTAAGDYRRLLHRVSTSLRWDFL